MKFGSLIPWREKTNLPVTRDETYDPFVSFRREVDLLFDDFLNGFGSTRAMGGWQGPTPIIDVADNEKELVVTAELPGLNDKDFDVTLAGDVLTIKGEKRAEKEDRNGDAYYVERRYGSFSRSLRLPFEVKDEKVEAKYDKGVLTVRVPKPAEAQRAVRRIEVKAA